MKNLKISLFAPILAAFFAMGYVDLVGISTNYVKSDFGLSDTMTNLLGSFLFFWFLVLAVPTGMLMNKFGRRNTVALSIGITTVSMLVPIFDYSFATMILSFALLGIGNTLLQVSVNPLVADVVPHNKLASAITLGQFVKSIAAFATPILVLHFAKEFGNWRTIYPVLAAVSLIPSIWLASVKIEESAPAKNSSFCESFALLKNSTIAILFCGILIHVGIDVGINITAPKILIDKANIPLSEAGYATSLYFLCKTAASFAGAVVLTKMSPQKFFVASVAVMLAAVAALLFCSDKTAIFVCIALVGIGNANIFSVIFSRALLILPERKNEISGLMVMGIAGGGIFPLLMGISSDLTGSQTGAIAVILVCVLYLCFVATKLGDETKRA